MEWGDWTDCSASCGNGLKTRDRSCSDPRNTCEGYPQQRTICHEESCPATKPWRFWSDWTECSVTCGQGNRHRIRQCSGEPGECGSEEQSIEEQFCWRRTCSVYSDWQEWSQCSAPCDGGWRRRDRICYGTQCVGEAIEAVRCNVEPCELEPQWSDFGPCSATCGTAFKTRTRKCKLGTGESVCSNAFQHVPCHLHACAQYSPWGSWSACSVTCGESIGTSMRVRVCKMGTCAEDLFQKEACNADLAWRVWNIPGKMN